MRRLPGGTNDKRSMLGRATLVGIALLVVVSLFTMPAAGHAYLSESNPQNGAALDTAPETVELSYAGDGIELADVTVHGPNGSEISGDTTIDSDDRQLVSVPIENAGDGMYTVQWEVLADDGHTTSGTFFFTVGEEQLDRDAVRDTYSEDDDDDGTLFESGAKGILLLALIGLVGIPITAWVAVYPVSGRITTTTVEQIDLRIIQLVAGSAVLLALGVVGLGLTRSTALGATGGPAVQQFIETTLGTIWLGQLALTGAIVGILIAAYRNIIERRAWLAAVFLGGIAMQLTVSWSSHSATAVDRLQGTVIDFVHIFGAGLWVGGLVVLAVVVQPLVRGREPIAARQSVAAIIRRYSIVALTGVTLAGTTGIFLTAWHAPTAEALLGTLYGTVLTTKTGLVLFALGIGGVVRFVLLRSLDPTAQGVFGRTQPTPTAPVREDGGESTTLRRVIWGVRIELVVLIGVILLSGMLTSIPTAAVAAGDEGIPQASIETEHDGGVVELSALPADDANDRLFVHEYEPVIYEATFRDQSGELISSDRTVRLLATHEESDTAIEIDLEETQDGTYATVQALPAHGEWDLRVSGQPEDTFVAEWFELYVIIDHPEHTHDHSHGDLTGEQTPFAGWLGLLGLVVGVIGMVAVSIETIRFGRRQH